MGDSVAENDGGGGVVNLESVEGDGGRRKGKLNRVVADALTRLSDGTASTPRVHRLPRFPRIPGSAFCSQPHPCSFEPLCAHNIIPAECDAYMHGRRVEKWLEVVYSADLVDTRRAGQSVSGTEYNNPGTSKSRLLHV